MQNVASSSKKLSSPLSFLLLMIGGLSLILSSPKCTIPFCAWIAPAVLLFFFRYSSLKRKYLWLLLTMTVSQLVAFYKVVPIPGLGLVIFVLINSLLASLPYLIDKAFANRSLHCSTTLVFPVVFTAIEFVSSFGPWGAWISVANTQFAFSFLSQLASVTGIWGIAFLLYWFASYVVWIIGLRMNGQSLHKTVFIYPVVLMFVIIGGAIRFYNNDVTATKIKVAGVTIASTPFLEAMYKDVNAKELHIPVDASPISPEVHRANTAFVKFIEHPNDAIFITASEVVNKITDSLFLLSKKAAQSGANLIVWSEGSLIVLKQNEPSVIKRAQGFAKENKVDLLLAMAVIHPGKITPGKKFLENKSIYIDHNGAIKNIFYKNKPVPGVEPSFAGNGVVPSIKTEYGNIATSICYDADFPSLMQQLGSNKTGLLLLPSGDWKAISPYHSEAAVYRAIENGCSLFRQANGGLSIAADSKGRIIKQKNFFENGEKFWLADVPVHHSNTFYNFIGNAFAYTCLLITAILFFALFVQWLMKLTSVFNKPLPVGKPASSKLLKLE